MYHKRAGRVLTGNLLLEKASLFGWLLHFLSHPPTLCAVGPNLWVICMFMPWKETDANQGHSESEQATHLNILWRVESRTKKSESGATSEDLSS